MEKQLVGHHDFVVSYGWVATAGASHWKSRWWVSAISSSLAGGSPRRAVLIGKAINVSPRFRRLLRVGRHGGASYWKSNWWVTVISSSLTGGSPRRWVLIETAYDNGGRARRILRHMARGGARRQRDNDDNNFWPWFARHTFAHGKHKPFGYPPSL